jgi:hypothetical protein
MIKRCLTRDSCSDSKVWIQMNFYPNPDGPIASWLQTGGWCAQTPLWAFNIDHPSEAEPSARGRCAFDKQVKKGSAALIK